MKLDTLVRFQNMDRRWIFLGMGIAILLPMLFPINLPFRVDERVQALYDSVEEIPAGSTVFISADFDPASRPELEPFFRANLHHLMRKDVKFVAATLWPSSPPLVMPIFEDLTAQYGKVYGVDWCFLGFKDGKELAIKAIGENIPETFPQDIKGTKIGDLPVTRGFKQARDFAYRMERSRIEAEYARMDAKTAAWEAARPAREARKQKYRQERRRRWRVYRRVFYIVIFAAAGLWVAAAGFVK